MDLAVPELHSFLGAVMGGGFVFMIARHFVIRTLEDIDQMSTHLNNIKAQLSGIDAQLNKVAKLEDMILDHDRKIIEIQTYTYKARTKSSVY